MSGVPPFVLVLALNAVAFAVLYQRFDGATQLATLADRVGAGLRSSDPVTASSGLFPHSTYTIHSSRVVLPDGVRPAFIVIEDGRIASVHEGVPKWGSGKAPFLDFKDAVIAPGVIDVHAHLNEPGRDSWEGELLAATPA